MACAERVRILGLSSPLLLYTPRKCSEWEPETRTLFTVPRFILATSKELPKGRRIKYRAPCSPVQW